MHVRVGGAVAEGGESACDGSERSLHGDVNSQPYQADGSEWSLHGDVKAPPYQADGSEWSMDSDVSGSPRRPCWIGGLPVNRQA